ncbi:MAG: MBOAT family protein [Cryomorphaceae bacterium]|nr:MBOAT family protein [Cryomorphaceae bacterium]
MVFSSTFFLLYFLPVFLLIYHLVGRSWKNWVILAASIFFYSWGAPKFIFVIIASTIIDFFIVRKMHESNDEKKRRQLLALSLILNLGLLLYFKYANFFVENVNTLLSSLGISPMRWLEVALPIGISFYTFQTLTYAVDVYRKVHAPLKKVSDYLLYIMSFPQMIAGPIVRFSAVADEIESRTERVEDKLLGAYRFAIGLAKKVIIANAMGEQADYIFSSDLNDINAGIAWVGILAYTFQIYFDFSGYSDMAIGLGKIMGFHFPENFNSPYISRSITEFWRRWHITLGGFMRDYLYIPLGGNKVSTKGKLYRNLIIVFLLSGLWHGASWNFILWGAYHGTFLILDRLFLARFMERLWQPISILLTFLFVMFGWVIFRLESLQEIGLYFSKLFDFRSGWYCRPTVDFKFVLYFAIFFSFIGATRMGAQLTAWFFESKQHRFSSHLFLTAMSVGLLIVSVAIVTASDFNPFIYFRF